MNKLRLALSVILISLLSLHAFAAGRLDSVKGDVSVVLPDGRTQAARPNLVVLNGSKLVTGAEATATLRMDDGQVIALSENTDFRIDNFKFEAAKPESGSAVFSLLKGALRSLSGLIAQRNRDNFALRAPQATIGIRGTDFMIALVNPMYLQVLQGSIASVNAAGTAAFTAGTSGMVASSAVLGAVIPAAALPATVAATFSQLGSLSLAAGTVGSVSTTGSGATSGTAAPGAGAAGATAAAVGGVTTATVVAVVVAVTAVVAATSRNDETTTAATTGTTGTTGTQ